jgi:tetratricopeptide (TPR) repeat protein
LKTTSTLCAVAAAAQILVVVGCATAPQPVTKIVNGRVIVTRAVSPEAYEHVARALLYEEEERWEEAADELQRALPFDDEAAEVRAHLAELFVRLGRLDDAAEQIEHSLKIDPTVEGHLAAAHLKQARGDGPAALDSFRRAVALALSNEDADASERAHLELSDAQIVALDVAGALDTTRELVQTSPDSQRGRVQLAALSWAVGHLDDAEASLKTALEEEPGDIDARVLLAEVQAAAGHIAEAKATFRDAIDRADAPLPIAQAVAGWLVLRGDQADAVELGDRVAAEAVDADTLTVASQLERTIKRYDRALDLAERARNLGAPPGRVAVLAGEALAAKGDHAGALARYLGVSRDASEYVDARLHAGELLRDDGKTDDAARVLDEALVVAGSEHERIAELVAARSAVDEKRGDAARAARRLDEALARDHDDARLMLARAAVEERRGEWRQALAMAEKLLAREPRNVEALNFAGFVAADHAAGGGAGADAGVDLQRAIRRLQAAVALSPGSGGVIDSLGWSYFRAGDLARATAFLEQAGRLEPGDPEILGHLGDLYEARHERARALETYRRALTLSPPDKLARELTDRVRTLEAKSAAGR